MPCVNEIFIKHNLISHKDISDKWPDCLGIVQDNDWCNGMTTWIYGKNSLKILCEIVKADILVLYVDSTK